MATLSLTANDTQMVGTTLSTNVSSNQATTQHIEAQPLFSHNYWVKKCLLQLCEFSAYP